MHLGNNSTHKKKSLKNEKIVKRAGACAIEFWVKRTRACDVCAAENGVCECACVRGKNSSQLTVCYPNRNDSCNYLVLLFLDISAQF